jgi:prepilin peptidase CpaA
MTPVGFAMLIPLLIWATCTDLAGRRIPNLIVVSGALLGIALAASTGWTSLANAMGGCILGMALLLPLYAVHGMAAGDIKLMGMAGMFLGTQETATAVVYVFAAGGVLAVGWWAMRRLSEHGSAPAIAVRTRGIASGTAIGPMGAPCQKQSMAQARMPYALAIAAGVGAYLYA